MGSLRRLPARRSAARWRTALQAVAWAHGRGCALGVRRMRSASVNRGFKRCAWRGYRDRHDSIVAPCCIASTHSSRMERKLRNRILEVPLVEHAAQRMQRAVLKRLDCALAAPHDAAD